MKMNCSQSDIRLCVPFLNDAGYIDSLLALSAEAPPGRVIHEVYGSMPSDPVGNLRPPESIRPMSFSQLKSMIEKLHKHGIKFNYVLNSELMPVPLSESYRESVLTFLRQLSDAGVDEVTVTIPYLITLIRRHFPDMRVNASICNEIASVKEAAEFESLGADVIVLDRDANRDFPLLRAIRRQIRGGMKVLCNSACVYHCVNVHYHGTYSSALSSSALSLSDGEDKTFPTPYCNFYCRRLFFSDLTELIRMHWIRPEDMELYAREGISLFKIDGRDKNPAYLMTVIRAYLTGTWEGSFFHLLQPEFCERTADISDTPVSAGSPEPLWDGKSLAEKTAAFLSESENWQVGIDNRNLDGFAAAFADEKVVCNGSCSECGYCDLFAKDIVADRQWQQEIVRLMDANLERYF